MSAQKAAHTPGPLRYEEHRSGGYMILTERGIPIANVDCLEDAVMFAAAPAMLEALRETWLTLNKTPGGSVQPLRGVLARIGSVLAAVEGTDG